MTLNTRTFKHVLKRIGELGTIPHTENALQRSVSINISLVKLSQRPNCKIARSRTGACRQPVMLNDIGPSRKHVIRFLYLGTSYRKAFLSGNCGTEMAK